ncbi:MAG: glycosyl transferase [Bryobacterales bacterium]|nr:glycosyl transferase [Bryobacterales bacterium]
MADFFQNGRVTTLHNLNRDAAARLERQLVEFSENTSVTLVLPALYSEFEGPAMARIAEQLHSARFLGRIVLALGQADEGQYLHARSFFDSFRVPVDVLQVDHPRIASLLDRLKIAGLDPGPGGKGRACWLAYGYALARRDCDVIALHDCDIKTYTRELLVRLCYPLMHPDLNFDFCKGYYARCSDRLHGRVTRLFISPLIRALHKLAPHADLLPFLDSFRYVLAGEFAMNAKLARTSRIPSNWGLEIGMLAEVHRSCAASAVCQTELADNYDHKHQVLNAGAPTTGLRKMAADIAAVLLRALAAEGVALDRGALDSASLAYENVAHDMLECYAADAAVNGLRFDRDAEEGAITAFRYSLQDASAGYLADPAGAPRVPSWARVQSALPHFLRDLESVVHDTDFAKARPRVHVAIASSSPVVTMPVPLLASSAAV